MSSEKINVTLIEKVIERAYELTGTKNNAQLAEKIGISSGAFNNRKKRGTIHELIFDWAVKNNYDLNYLFYGEKTKKGDIGDKTLLEIQEWLNESGRGNNDMKIWFKVQFDNKFPEFVEWKKRKDERQEQHNITEKSKIA